MILVTKINLFQFEHISLLRFLLFLSFPFPPQPAPTPPDIWSEWFEYSNEFFILRHFFHFWLFSAGRWHPGTAIYSISESLDCSICFRFSAGLLLTVYHFTIIRYEVELSVRNEYTVISECRQKTLGE